MAAGQIKAPIIIPLKNPQSMKTKILTSLTKIELISESPDVDIYFTVNGEKPDQFKMTKGTFKYNVPFTLPAGKRIVKAVAVSKDCVRESNIVTKVFEIDFLERHDDISNKLQPDAYGFLEELKDSKRTFGESNVRNDDNYSLGQDTNLRYVNPHYLESNFKKREPKVSDFSHGNDLGCKSSTKQFNNNYDRHLNRSVADATSQSLRLQRETDFLKCIYCLAPRPSDVQAKFCNNCGQVVPPLPQSRLPPPENGQLGMCVHCRSTVPMNVLNCLVCESPLNIQNQPQATLRLREKTLCTICGTGNPPNIDSCLTCESKLPESGKPIKMVHHQQPPEKNFFADDSSKDALICCGNCGRQNNIEARFCDWCGVKQLNQNNLYSQVTHIMCSICMGSNECNASYCCQCGNRIEPPHRHIGNNYGQIAIPLHIKQTNGIHKLQDFDKNHSMYLRKNAQNDASSQTVGLFFPSTAQLKKNDDDKQKHIVSNTVWEKPLSLSVVSPGKGFWRKQTDHVIAHLKAHASNTSEFQAMIGEPRMGKLISANVHEEDFELNLTLTFALKGYKDPYQNGTSEDCEKQFLSSMLKRSGSFDSFRSDSTLNSNAIRKFGKTPTTSARCRSAKGKTQSKKSEKTSNIQISDSDRDLLKVIGKSGDGRESEIEDLIEGGANPKAISRKGIPFIMVAVRNKHFDAIRVLKKFGADVNAIDAETGNTCLHEAVSMGSLNEDSIKTLIELGASTKMKNYKGETAYDLAVKMKNESAMKFLSTNIGKNQVEKLSQPKQIDNFEDEKI